jgi:hypothetical protein
MKRNATPQCPDVPLVNGKAEVDALNRLQTETAAQLDASHIASVRTAYKKGDLTLYLGAGVSKGNGLPTWSELVLAMYFTAMEGDWKLRWRPFSN